MPSTSLPLGSLFLRSYDLSHSSAFARGDIAILKDTIRKNGLRRDLVVTEIPRAPGRFEVVDGERRLVAIKELVSEGYTHFSEIPSDIRVYEDRALMVVDRVLLNLHRPWELADRADLATFARKSGLSENGLAMLTGIPPENWLRESFDLAPPTQPERLEEIADFVREHGQSILNSGGLVTILTAAFEYARGMTDRDTALARMLTAKLPSQVPLKNIEQMFESKLLPAIRAREIAERAVADANARIATLEREVAALRKHETAIA